MDLLEGGSGVRPRRPGDAVARGGVHSPPDAALPDSLALLSWIPHPTPHALPYGETMVESVRREWDVCTPAPPPAPSLWTFDGQRLGPDPDGWRLRGLLWPDPPDTVDVGRPRVDVHVTEPWRTGDAVADLLGPRPATIVGDAHRLHRTRPDRSRRWKRCDDGNPPSVVRRAGPPDGTPAARRGARRRPLAARRRGARAPPAGWEPAGQPRARRVPGPDPRSTRSATTSPTARDRSAGRRPTRRSTPGASTTIAPNELRNAVRVTPTSPLTTASVLLLVPSAQLAIGSLVLAHTAPDESEIDAVTSPRHDRLGGGVGSLPPEWWRPDRPDRGPTRYNVPARVAARIAGSFKAQDDDAYDLAFVELPDTDGASVIDIGWDRGATRGPPPFYVVALVRAAARRAPSATRARASTSRDAGRFSRRRSPRTRVTTHCCGRTSVHRAGRPGSRRRSSRRRSRPRSTPTAGPPRQVEEHIVLDGPEERRPGRPRDPGSWRPRPPPASMACCERQPVRLALTTQSVTSPLRRPRPDPQGPGPCGERSHPAPAGGQPDDLVTIPLVPGGEPPPPQSRLSRSTSAFHKALREVADELSCVIPGPAPPPARGGSSSRTTSTRSPSTSSTCTPSRRRLPRRSPTPTASTACSFTTSRFRTTSTTSRDSSASDRVEDIARSPTRRR